MRVLMLGCLTLFLTACATNKPLMQPCDVPELRGDTYRDLAILAVEQKAALEICNAKIEAQK